MNLSIALTGKRQTSKPYSPCWKWFKYAILESTHTNADGHWISPGGINKGIYIYIYTSMQQKQRMCRTRMSFLKNSLAQDKQKGLMNN